MAGVMQFTLSLHEFKNVCTLQIVQGLTYFDILPCLLFDI